MKRQPINRKSTQFMLPLSTHTLLDQIRKQTGYTATQAVIAAAEAYASATEQGEPQLPQRGADRAPLRIVLPERTDWLLGVVGERCRQVTGKRVSRQDVVVEVLRTYIVRERNLADTEFANKS